MTSVAPDGRPELRGAWIDTPRQAKARRQLQARHERDRKRNRRKSSALSFVFIGAIVALLGGLAIAMQVSTYDFWGGLLVAPIVLVLTLPLASRAARKENDPTTGQVILVALLVKLAIGTPLRFYQTFYLYKTADATGYMNEGALLIEQFRRLDFGNLGGLVGTRFIEIVTGLVLAVIDITRFGAFIVFSWMGFLGLYCFYQAFRIAFPEGDHRRYRLLLFFWPSLLFWPSSVGKDAWMLLVLGLCALGVAQLLVGRVRGGIWLGMGIWGCVMVRPHLALLIVAGFLPALVLRRNRGAHSRFFARPAGTAVLMLGMLVVGAVLFAQAQSFFKLDNLDLESAQQLLESTSQQTSEGGSQYAPIDPSSPVGYIEAAVTVMFRPFPFEIGGAGAIAGIEGVLLLGLVVSSWRRLLRVPKLILQNAFVAFAVAYCFAFIYAFAAISNFGILARERAQFFPILFVLLAIPKPGSSRTDDEDERATAIAV